MSEASRIVGVHGVGNHRKKHTPASAADGLSAVWTRAFGGEAIRVAYYADVLQPSGQQGSIDPIDEVDAAAVFDWVGQLGAPEEVAQGRLAAPVRGAADWVARTFGLDQAATRVFVGMVFRDVPTYLTNQLWREAARARVADAIREQRPEVVIAHSLGSVVAYETLWANPDLHVPTLVTVGSPLALPSVVFHRLDPAPASSDDGRRAGARPPNVDRWCNLADHGDVIAIPRPLTDHFDGVDVDLAVDISLFDFHRVANYLRCDPVRHVVTEALATC